MPAAEVAVLVSPAAGRGRAGAAAGAVLDVRARRAVVGGHRPLSRAPVIS